MTVQKDHQFKLCIAKSFLSMYVDSVLTLCISHLIMDGFFDHDQYFPIMKELANLRTYSALVSVNFYADFINRQSASIG